MNKEKLPSSMRIFDRICFFSLFAFVLVSKLVKVGWADARCQMTVLEFSYPMQTEQPHTDKLAPMSLLPELVQVCASKSITG